MHLESRKFSQPCNMHEKSQSNDDVEGRMRTKRGFSLSTVVIVFTFLLMGSLGTFAQSDPPYPDDLSYFLNGNNPYSSAVGGQIYRGDGTFYTGTWAGSVSCSTTSPYPCTGGNWTSSGALTSPVEQCLACHYHANSSSNRGAMYLMTGHKNTFRKVAPGTPWAGPDGNTYTTADTYYGSGSTYNWTTGTVTVGSCDPFSVPLQLGLTVLDPACSYTGYASSQSVLYLLGGWMYYGGNSGSGDPQLNSVFDAGAVAGFTGEQYPNGNYDCMRCHATGYNFVAANSSTGTLLGGPVGTSYAGPEPTTLTSTSGGYTAITDAQFRRWPTDQTSGTSSWYLTGVQCERCHITDVNISTAPYNVSHPSSGGLYGLTIPTVATGQASTALCMECHREETVNTAAKTITPTYPPVAIDKGYCSDFSNNPYSSCTATWIYKPTIPYGMGTTFLNSPHAGFTGTLAQNNQNSPDLSIAISGTYSATVATPEGGYFKETSGTDSGQNKGCTGCHDPHYTTVVTPSQYTANNALYHTLQGTTETNCSNGTCHSNITNNLMATIKHPVGIGTPFPTGTAADVPGACVVCHMQAASPNPSYPTQGVPQNHFFRVSVDPNYYTFPTAAQYYSGTTTLNTATDTVTGFTGAIWQDVDIACGQCHAGGNASGENPYGIVQPNPAPPAFARIYLASAATGIHGFDTLPTAATPTFSLGSGTYTSAQTVTLSDATSGAAIYYNINTVAPPTASSTKYTAPIVVSSNTTIQAVAEGGIGYNPNTLSATATAQYNIQAATPTFSLGPGIYYKPQTLTLSDTTSGAPIYYTTDGSNPTTSPTAILYGGGSIAVSVPTTFNVVAGNNAGLIDGTGLTYSTIAAETITIKALPPTFSPGGGTYTGAQTVQITNNSSSSAATIYYAFNAAPTTANSCASPCSVAVSASETLEAVSAYDTGLLSQSSVTSAVYTLKAPAPTFSPGAGTYKKAQGVNVTLADTPGLTICYTTNGTAPAVNTAGVCTAGSAYTAAIPVSVTTTIEAVAGGNGYGASTVVRAIYTLQ